MVEKYAIDSERVLENRHISRLRCRIPPPKSFLYSKGYIPNLEERVGSSATQFAVAQLYLCIYGWGKDTTNNYRAFHREMHYNVPLVLAHLRLVGMDLRMVGRHFALSRLYRLHVRDCLGEKEFLNWLLSDTGDATYPLSLQEFSFKTL